LRELLAQVEMVAASDSTTALILGETGTGKELIARAIHQLSERRERTLVKLNCAAIPLGLLESELFGHEKGAFTGAVAQKVGRLELAHQGTLFLDEVGEIPLELQPKLLRAIQEREIEHLGGTRIIRVNVRIIAATNRDLKQMVAEHQFRNDLFYRLNVFPLRVPPLRERQADIPLLVRHFVQKHARRMKRDINRIPTATMQILCDYPWPGNVRELENFIERSVIVSRGSILNAPTSELLEVHHADCFDRVESFEKLTVNRPQKTDKELIVKALQEARGVISGPGGAAAKLGLKRTTLLYRMKRIGL
jgi:formate hydrogenlyase transcriptional activator